MRIDFHKNFDKRFAKLNQKQKKAFKLRLALFVADQSHPKLNNHPLRGKYQRYRSINVTGNMRAVFKAHSEKHVEFVDIGSHSQLYG